MRDEDVLDLKVGGLGSVTIDTWGVREMLVIVYTAIWWRSCEEFEEVNKGEWRWMKIDEDKWRWMKINGDEWRWMKMNEGEWRWMKMNEDEWRWMKVYKVEWIAEARTSSNLIARDDSKVSMLVRTVYWEPLHLRGGQTWAGTMVTMSPWLASLLNLYQAYYIPCGPLLGAPVLTQLASSSVGAGYYSGGIACCGVLLI